MIYFKGRDLELIEKLEFNPDLEPSYDAIKNCLVWEDERPDGLTPEGYELLSDLWIARSFIHRGIPFSTWVLDPDYYERVWKEATEAKFKWPGFNRLELRVKENKYYLQKMKEQKTSNIGV
ncbi:MAG: hypothetical protein PVI97_05140 [Candidatus Thiodiazotropha sp.]|jgi:hypothetical protein